MRVSVIPEYLRAHLQGGLPWGVVLGVNLVLLRMLLFPIQGYWLGLLAVLLVGLWQVLGAFSHIASVLRQVGGLVPAVLLAAGSLYIVLSAAIALANFQAARWPHVPPEPEPLLELAISADGQAVYVEGPLNFPKNTALRVALENHPELERLVLDSQGGSIFAARAMALSVAEFGLSTEVETICYSACTLVFMAGETRGLAENGRLGFHGYRFDSAMRTQTLDPDVEEARDRAYLIERGVAAGFVERALATDPSELWIPVRQELIAAGVLRVGTD